jgi:ketosteroid isomerase-like protein
VKTAAAAQQEFAEKSSKPGAGDRQAIVPAIEGVLLAQQQAWNADELTFSSSGKTTRGWDNTLKRYRERYSSREQMGKLKLDQFEITPLSDSAALVLGNWQLERATEPVGGNFSLILRKIGDRWLIVHDHTSQREE